MASTATVSWDCTTGEILATSNLGNAAGAALPLSLQRKLA